MQKQIGFLTGVFDLPHTAHFQLLKAARDRCDYLIVGLTTDHRCSQEKRTPVMNFDQRKTVLTNCKWVDLVVENKGQTKQTMWAQLQFTILFTSDEYIERPEFTSFRKDCPDVPVIAIPTSSGVRTTDTIRRIEQDVLNDVTVLAMANSGPILRLKTKDSDMVVKPIPLGATEFKAHNTSNCYNMPIGGPRNWRRPNATKQYPNITGINSYRELSIQTIIKHQPWNLVVRCATVFEDPAIKIPVEPVPSFQHVNDERKCPQQLVWMYQKYGGPVLYDWVQQHQHDADFRAHLREVLEKVVRIIETDLLPNQIIHGDIHAHNICVDQHRNVYLIDWGWCLHGSFVLDPAEYAYLQQCLHTQFDLHHFVESLWHDFGAAPWSDVLPMVQSH